MSGHEPASRARRVRSFVRREGRLTPAQRRALVELGPRYLLSPEQVLDPLAVFGRRAPLVLDIGFGDGAALLAQAQARPDWDFLGVDVYRPGVGRLLRGLHEEGLTNVRVYMADIVDLLHAGILPPASFDRVQIFFPDPWPKKRHHKRRLIQPAFLDAIARVLKPGGQLHIATDWADYAAHILGHLRNHPAFRNLSPTGAEHPHAAQLRPETKYERRAREQGRSVWDFLFERIAQERRDPSTGPGETQDAGTTIPKE
ncbi:MAG: tRNA (guanosine(46)-N7)-methyltransferase TrmB [Chloroflexi bacterium]|nr:tRNA (guanosine(46)-N7)-methyltransferase TrmB [Chloroflexota bacterium]